MSLVHDRSAAATGNLKVFARRGGFLLAVWLVAFGLGKLAMLAGDFGSTALDIRLNIFAISLILALASGWLAIVHWVAADTQASRLNVNTWVQAFYLWGIPGLLATFLASDLSIGLAIFGTTVGVPLVLYVERREDRVAERQRIKNVVDQWMIGRLPEWLHRRLRSRTSHPVLWRLQPTASGTVTTVDALPPLASDSSGVLVTGADGSSVALELLDAAGENEVETSLALVDRVLLSAAQARATDLQVRAEGSSHKLIYRIDGVLRPGRKLPSGLGKLLIDRLKDEAGMDITERRRPQDGGLQRQIDRRRFELRLATQPTHTGEQLSIRLLDQTEPVGNLQDLGITRSIQASFSRVLSRRQGLVIVSGPPGSGKSTTLRAALGEFDPFQHNIITIEDPVEFKLENVTQVSVDRRTGQTFAEAMRGVLRQDADVIMLGEIRDTESARMACEAANSGRLVLTSIHAHDAPTAVRRMIELGVNPSTVATAISGVISQRLIRRLCLQCRIPCQPNAAKIAEYQIDLSRVKNPVFYAPRASGSQLCTNCHSIGYRDRKGIFQLLEFTQQLRELVSRNATAEKIGVAGRKQGMKKLLTEGVKLVLRGESTFDEIERVVR